MANNAFSPSIPLDMEKFSTITDGKNTYQEELLQLFFHNAEECLAIMELNFPASNRQKWVNSAKELKNLSYNIGAQELYKICEIAEKISIMSDDDIKKMLGAIKIHLQRLRAFVRNTRY